MKRGDIILIPFYFTDFKNYKLRPALIVSANQSQQDDFIVAFISTVIPSSPTHPAHLIINDSDNFFQTTGLHKTSVIKCDKLMTVNKSIVQGLMGELPDTIMKTINTKLKTALSI